MIKSMTGYGRKKIEDQGLEISVEIKSVNHRYLDVTVKTPRLYAFLEEPVKGAVSVAVSRGKIDVYVTAVKKDGGDVTVTPNLALAWEYLSALERLRDELGLTDDISVMKAAQLPEVMTVGKQDPDAEAAKALALEAARQALEEYNAMRQTEGQRLCQDILERIETLTRLTAQVERRSPKSVEEYRQKIQARMLEILGDTQIAEQRILAEAALFADKVSVTEEIVRLRSHLAQAAALVQGDQPAGRKLDFLAQELNREANTIGSKANDYELAQTVVEIKAEIEKIREQIQNLE